MKVIEEGFKTWSKEVVCNGGGHGGNGCGARLLIEKSDLFQTSRVPSFDLDRTPQFFATFECVLCRTLTDLKRSPFNAKELPPRPRCHAARDGECSWEKCPQNIDAEPKKSGRHCPLDTREDE